MRSRWRKQSFASTISETRQAWPEKIRSLSFSPLCPRSCICDGLKCHLSTSNALRATWTFKTVNEDLFWHICRWFFWQEIHIHISQRRRSCSATPRDQSPVDVCEQDFASPHQFLIDLFIYSWISLACLQSTHEYLKYTPGPWCVIAFPCCVSSQLTVAHHHGW